MAAATQQRHEEAINNFGCASLSFRMTIIKKYKFTRHEKNKICQMVNKSHNICVYKGATAVAVVEAYLLQEGPRWLCEWL